MQTRLRHGNCFFFSYKIDKNSQKPTKINALIDYVSYSLHPSTSFHDERKLTTTKRRRNQYENIDSLNRNDSEIHEIEKDEEVANSESESTANRQGNRGAQSWNSLRAVVRYYCSLRKIKRQ